MNKHYTLPELAILNEYRYETISFLFDYRTDSHDVIMPMRAWTHPTKAQSAALVRLVKRGALAHGALPWRDGYYVVTPAAYESIYGVSFAYAFTRALQDHYNTLLNDARVTRDNLQAIRHGESSAWQLESVYQTYADAFSREYAARNLTAPNWQAYASGDRRALLFHHYVTDAYTNIERYLQSIEQLIASVEIRGAVKTAVRYGINFQAA